MKKNLLLGLSAVLLVVLVPAALPAQQRNPSMVKTERQAMQKLSFLAGQWRGPVTIYEGPGKPLHLMQTEDVQYKLSGLVMLVEGKSTNAQGQTLFSALATIAYDPASHSYRFRAYHGGQYLDTQLKVQGDGFRWGFGEGPAHIMNSMHLTKAGEWSETTQVTVGSHAPFQSMVMGLRHKR